MKVLKKIMRDGKIVIKLDTLDDLWHLYNIVDKGDQVIARTSRKVKIGNENARKQDSVRKYMTLKLKVEDVSFHNFTNRVRIKGTIVEGPEDWVSTGSYHTFNVEPNDKITIIKEHWPRYALKRLKEAEEAHARPVCLVITIEDGVAELILVADYGIREAVSVRQSISRKHGSQKSHDATMREFFSSVVLAVRSQLEQNEIALVVIAGPGFVKDHFKDYLLDEGISDLAPVIVQGTGTTGIPAAKEILYHGVISEAIEGLKIEKETKLVEEVLKHLAKEDGLATYGDDEVERAVQYGAVEELLITDKKLRDADEERRRWMDKLIRDTENARGSFHVVSTDHPAGDQLQNLGGLAAILRFSIGQ